MSKNVLITGAAKRLGAANAVMLHQRGCNIVLHYHHSEQQALELCQQLNRIRADSAVPLQADLLDLKAVKSLAESAMQAWGHIDVLINNASGFYPTPINKATEQDWESLVGGNLKAPFFLAQALLESLQQHQGCIINMIDIHAERGLPDHPIYTIAKAGLAAMTKSLAKDLAPDIRVNGIAPGAILWPEQSLPPQQQNALIERIALKKKGDACDISNAVEFLIFHADYMTGQIITVDGGRTLYC